MSIGDPSNRRSWRSDVGDCSNRRSWRSDVGDCSNRRSRFSESAFDSDFSPVPELPALHLPSGMRMVDREVIHDQNLMNPITPSFVAGRGRSQSEGAGAEKSSMFGENSSNPIVPPRKAISSVGKKVGRFTVFDAPQTPSVRNLPDTALPNTNQMHIVAMMPNTNQMQETPVAAKMDISDHHAPEATPEKPKAAVPPRLQRAASKRASGEFLLDSVSVVSPTDSPSSARHRNSNSSRPTVPMLKRQKSSVSLEA